MPLTTLGKAVGGRRGLKLAKSFVPVAIHEDVTGPSNALPRTSQGISFYPAAYFDRVPGNSSQLWYRSADLLTYTAVGGSTFIGKAGLARSFIDDLDRIWVAWTTTSLTFESGIIRLVRGVPSADNTSIATTVWNVSSNQYQQWFVLHGWHRVDATTIHLYGSHGTTNGQGTFAYLLTRWVITDSGTVTKDPDYTATSMLYGNPPSWDGAVGAPGNPVKSMLINTTSISGTGYIQMMGHTGAGTTALRTVTYSSRTVAPAIPVWNGRSFYVISVNYSGTGGTSLFNAHELSPTDLTLTAKIDNAANVAYELTANHGVLDAFADQVSGLIYITDSVRGFRTYNPTSNALGPWKSWNTAGFPGNILTARSPYRGVARGPHPVLGVDGSNQVHMGV